MLAVLGLFMALALPMLAGTRSGSQRAQCLNQLRQIGGGVHAWATDHGNRAPWLTLESEGGTFAINRTIEAAWWEWLTLSNELGTPKLLACPADEGVRPAGSFGTAPDGLLNSSLRANAVSYAIGLHSVFEYPYSLIALDRNITYLGSASCSTGFQRATAIRAVDRNWTNAVHGLSGHLLFAHGGVEMTDQDGFSQFMRRDVSSLDREHLLRAR